MVLAEDCELNFFLNYSPYTSFADLQLITWDRRFVLMVDKSHVYNKLPCL